MLEVQSNVGYFSLLNHAPNFRVVLLGMVASNSHGHNEFPHGQVRFGVLITLGLTRAHPCHCTGFHERLKHLLNFGGLCVEFLHWVSLDHALVRSFSLKPSILLEKLSSARMLSLGLERLSGK